MAKQVIPSIHIPIQEKDGSISWVWYMFLKYLSSVEGGSGASSLSQLSDVNISSPTNNQYLVYDNGIWKNQTLSISWGQIGGDIDDQADLKNALDSKQGVLTAGTNITIDENNVISATGGGTGAVESVNGKTGVVNLSASDVHAATEAQGALADTAVQPAAIADMATKTELSAKQDKLTAGANITIENNVISATGGSELPDQTGNAGKFLVTNGTNASWGTTLTKTLYLTGNNTQEKIIFNWGTNSSNNIICRATDYSLLFGYRNGGTFRQEFVFDWLFKSFHPINWQSGSIVTLGTSNYKWSNVYTNKLNNGADIEVPNQAGTMVVANPTGATQGQVLTLDSNLKPAWADASSGSTRYNVGDIFYTMRNDNGLNGAVECDGATYNTTDFTGTESIGELLEAGKLDYVSLTAYATAISTKGWCDKIGWNGAGTTSFRVPTLTPHIIQKNNIPVKGTGMSLGVTNGTDNAGTVWVSGVALDTKKTQYGQPVSTAGQSSSGGISGVIGITTDSTKSGIIADTSDTAQLRVMIQLATGATDTALETCTSVLADVAALKYDYVVDFQAPTATNGYTWYRKYKSGWVEQGGETTGGVNSVTLPIEMADDHYTVIRTQIGSSQQSYFPAWVAGFDTRTTTGFTFQSATQNNIWQVSGMAAS